MTFEHFYYYYCILCCCIVCTNCKRTISDPCILLQNHSSKLHTDRLCTKNSFGKSYRRNSFGKSHRRNSFGKSYRVLFSRYCKSYRRNQNLFSRYCIFRVISIHRTSQKDKICHTKICSHSCFHFLCQCQL